MKRIAGAAVLLMVIIFILHFTTKMVSTIEISAENGTQMGNLSHTITSWAVFSTSLLIPTILIIAIGTIIMAVYSLTKKR